MGEYHKATKTRPGFEAWLKECVTSLKDREEFLSRLGAARVDALKVRKHAWSARADFGN